MKKLLISGLCLSALGMQAQSPSTKPQLCWLETSYSAMPGEMGGAGLQSTKVWNSTISAVLIRNPKGDVLVDTGLGPNAEAQMNELPAAAKAFGMQVVAGAKDRIPLSSLLAGVNEQPQQVQAIVLTHTHYDHLGGAATLLAPIVIPQAEASWDLKQVTEPIITPPSLVKEVEGRFHVLAYDSGPYLGFKESKDFYGDKSIVIVPLPGHTPGSQGVFVRVGTRQVFLIGDASDTLEAAERGLPKSSAIRGATDSEPALADETTRRIAAFHRKHPEISLIPAHDRQAYLAVFPGPSNCVAQFPQTGKSPSRAE